MSMKPSKPPTNTPKTCSIYALVDECGVAGYIGKTAMRLKYRLKRHIEEAETGSSLKCQWIRSLPAPPTIRLLKTVLFDDGNKEEIAMIDAYLRQGATLSNSTPGGFSASANAIAALQRPASIAKAAAMKTGKPLSAEHRAAIGRAHKGKTRSPEWKANIGAGNRGKVRSPEAIAAHSKAMTGRKQSPEHSEKIRAALLAHFAAKSNQPPQEPDDVHPQVLPDL
jgi:hypothetical protein